MTPTPYPTLNIPYEQIVQTVVSGVRDTINDPILPIVLAPFILVGVLALIVGGIRYALRSGR